MVTVVEADAAQAGKRGKATDEETKPAAAVGAVRKQRQPTPDHPPYCWMIGEAIDSLCERGGSEEDSISAFIRARYPGVPPAHDRFLRHYLDKHVAEGFFVCTAAGRYLRSSEEDTVGEHPVEQAVGGSSKEAFVGSSVAKVKRGRGRPRKDGLSSKSSAGKKDGAPSAMPKRSRQRRAVVGLADDEESVPTSLVAAEKKDGSQCRAVVPLAAAEDSVPASLVAVLDKDGGQAAPTTAKRRGRPRKLGMAKGTTDNSGEALVTAKKDGDDVPYTMAKEHEPQRELALVIFGDDSATTSILDKACSEAPPTTPGEGGQPLELAPVITTDEPVSAPTPAMDKGSKVPYTMDKEHEPPHELALVIFGDDSATTSIMDKACSKPPPTTPGEGDQPLELVPVTTTDVPVLPAPTPAMDKGSETINRALVAKNDSICTISTAPESSSKACDLALVVAGDISVPVLVADNDVVEEAPSATYNGVRQPHGSASTAPNKAGSKALSGTLNGSRRRCKLAKVVSPGDCSALTPVAGKKARRKVSFASPKLTPVIAVGCSNPASVTHQDSMEARKLYPVTANEVPDDPALCVLALPSLTPRAAGKA